MSAATALVLGMDAYRDYVEKSMPAIAHFFDKWPNISLQGFWFKLFDGPRRQRHPDLACSVAGSRLTGLGAVAVLGVLPASSGVPDRRHDLDLTFALTLVAMLLVSPITWDHYAVLLLLPGVLLWQRLPPGGRRTAHVRVPCPALADADGLLDPLHRSDDRDLDDAARPAVADDRRMSPPTYAMLGLFALVVSEVGRTPWHLVGHSMPALFVPMARASSQTTSTGSTTSNQDNQRHDDNRTGTDPPSAPV